VWQRATKSLKERKAFMSKLSTTLIAVLVLFAGNLSSSALRPNGASVAQSTQPYLVRAEQRSKAESLKNEANELFNSKKWEEALKLYQEAADMDPTNIMILCNRAFAHIKLENFENAVADADQSLKIDPKFTKAYYRRATARMMQGKLRLALQDLRTVLQLRPNDAAVQVKLRDCQRLWKAEAFSSAIRDDASALSLMATVEADLDKMQVEASYDGPRWEHGNLTQEFIDGMLETFKSDKRIHKKYLYKIILEAATSILPYAATRTASFMTCSRYLSSTGRRLLKTRTSSMATLSTEAPGPLRCMLTYAHVCSRMLTYADVC
jgi:tetratricopeptide (TPR) repeat protein